MFEFANPWFFLLLPLPILLWFFFPKAEPKMPAALKVPFYAHLKPFLNHKQHTPYAFKQTAFFMMVWVLLVTALAGPKWVGPPIPLSREGRNIMLLLDISGSMALDDMQEHGQAVSRLAVVKQAAARFVEERKGDHIGLILFGTRAYLQTPLTYDHHAVLLQLQDSTVGLAGETTSIGDAVGLAMKQLLKVPEKGRVIILLTDGANTSGVLEPLKAAELAKSAHIKIYTIGLGANIDPRSLGGMFLRLNAGADLDEDSLQKIADMTGGRYFRATDPKSLQKIYQMINQLETIQQQEAAVRPQYDYFPWLAGLSLILMMGRLGAVSMRTILAKKN